MMSWLWDSQTQIEITFCQLQKYRLLGLNFLRFAKQCQNIVSAIFSSTHHFASQCFFFLETKESSRQMPGKQSFAKFLDNSICQNN